MLRTIFFLLVGHFCCHYDWQRVPFSAFPLKFWKVNYVKIKKGCYEQKS